MWSFKVIKNNTVYAALIPVLVVQCIDTDTDTDTGIGPYTTSVGVCKVGWKVRLRFAVFRLYTKLFVAELLIDFTAM